MKIGILEDNPVIFEYMKIAFEMKGHQVDVYTQGAALLDTLFTTSGVRSPLPYDVITIDLLLPGEISGLEVVARIREAIPVSQLPIIVISGVALSMLEEVQKDFPQVPVLSKPFELHTLFRLLGKVQSDTGDDQSEQKQLLPRGNESV